MELSLASENSLSNYSRLGQPGRVGRRKSKDLRKSLIEITRNVCYVPRGIWHKMSSGVHSWDTENRIRIRFCCKAYNAEYCQVHLTYASGLGLEVRRLSCERSNIHNYGRRRNRERENPDEDSGHTAWHSVRMGGRHQLQATQPWQGLVFYGFNLFWVGSNSKVWFTSSLRTIHCPYYMMFRSWRTLQGSCVEIPPGAILWWPKEDHLWRPLWEYGWFAWSPHFIFPGPFSIGIPTQQASWPPEVWRHSKDLFSFHPPSCQHI